MIRIARYDMIVVDWLVGWSCGGVSRGLRTVIIFVRK